MDNKDSDKIILVLPSVVFFIIVMYFALRSGSNTLNVHGTDDEMVYMICDVYDVTYNGATIEINIILPNGELLTRQMREDDDLPEDFSEVVIQTPDLDKYSTYKIVGMR